MTEQEYLKEYDPSQYEKPSVTVDALVLTMNEEQQLEVLLTRRKSHPFQDRWSLPGSFVGIEESFEEAVARGLKQKTGLSNVYLEQLYTFGAADRDPRMRIISVAYIALVPKRKLHMTETSGAALFAISYAGNEIILSSKKLGIEIAASELAFDHGEELVTALERLKGKITYTDVAFELLADKNCFTAYELKMIYEAVLNKTLDTGNFRRSFKKRYIETNRVAETGMESKEFSKKPSATYKIIQ